MTNNVIVFLHFAPFRMGNNLATYPMLRSAENRFFRDGQQKPNDAKSADFY
jgi:hypothetical protein